ncbi:aldo/keto reductase family protein [Candidatus Marinarcus aquaticus]|uniref:Aldo/keto reductase n=1 Tax=Candidatus Marinarcus aquaticus TaxID=2044504 RepID=A0A4Q0XSL4_9BACT|nr:aldo/keto reductase [Candidatus Marinarcus aquaticus]RXJ59993.1 aldo/keto reductase [Candidatus Marinarcus aquaticus]
MNYLISNENVQIPALLYGTAWKKEETATLVEAALKAGFRGIDTACQPRHYNEKGVGDGIAQAIQSGLLTREELFLETKFTPKEGQDENSVPYNPNDTLFQQVLHSFQVSQKNLQTDYIDSLVLHSPLFPFKSLMSVWSAMESLYENKEVKQLGISNCYDLQTIEKLYTNAKVKPAVVQNRFYKDTNYDQKIRAWCNEKGILYLGFWTLTANPHILGSETLFHIARKYQKTPAQLFYRYLTQRQIIPLIGTTSVKHMQEDLSIFEFKLNQEELLRIDALL